MKKAALIMAGGSGSRLWPLTRKNSPKQAQRIFSDKPAFEKILEIVGGMIPAENIFVTVGESQFGYVSDSGILKENIVYQHQNRNTAPAILYGIMRITESLGGSDSVLSIIPSDHIIAEEDKLKEALLSSYGIAERTGRIVVIGTAPLYPSTGFGYLEFEKTDEVMKKVLAIREKPGLEDAGKWSADGNHLWSTGTFAARTDVLLDAYRSFQPEMYGIRDDRVSFFDRAESVSFDVGILGKARERLCAVVSGHSWMDAGTFEFLDRYLKSDGRGNTIHGKGIVFDAENTSIVSGGNMAAVAYGTSNLLIVNTDDVVLVCDKRYIQKIGELVDKLRAGGWEGYL